MSLQLADQQQAAPGARLPAPLRRLSATLDWPLLGVGILAIFGVVVRALVAGQSYYADELSTYWISATHSLGGVISLMYGTPHIPHPEITPPLYFIAAWATSQLGHSPVWLRLPALAAGAATIPLVYFLGRRSVGRPAALLASALTALSPFMIYYSTEARAYGVMMAFVVGATLSMLVALDTRRVRWWVIYGACSCGAIYTHYTSGFVLAAQLLWLLWSQPAARRPALLANLGAAIALIPWLPGLISDFHSPTLTLLSALSPFTAHQVRLILSHWLIGYPYVAAGGLRALPGTPALVLLALAALAAIAGIALRLRGTPVREWIGRSDRRVLLVVALALATPVCEAVFSAAGNHIFGVRNLAASWPFVALTCAAAVVASGRHTRPVAGGLAIAALLIAAVKMLGASFQRPDYQAASAYVRAHFRPGDVVIDETGALTPAPSPGPLSGLDTTLGGELPIIRADFPAERGHPFAIGDRIVPPSLGVSRAVLAARGHRIFVVTNRLRSDTRSLSRSGYRLLTQAVFPAINPTEVRVYARRPGGVP
jgi:mannosyltransferase